MEQEHNFFGIDMDYIEAIDYLDSFQFEDEFQQFVFRQMTNRYMRFNNLEDSMASHMDGEPVMETRDFQLRIPHFPGLSNEDAMQFVGIIMAQLYDQGLLNMELVQLSAKEFFEREGRQQPSTDKDAIDFLNNMWAMGEDNKDEDDDTLVE